MENWKELRKNDTTGERIMKDYYCVVKGYDQKGIQDDYEMLLGPNNFKCIITEPEDRNFDRDLAPLVKKLNTLSEELERKDKAIQQCIERLISEDTDEALEIIRNVMPSE